MSCLCLSTTPQIKTQRICVLLCWIVSRLSLRSCIRNMLTDLQIQCCPLLSAQWFVYVSFFSEFSDQPGAEVKTELCFSLGVHTKIEWKSRAANRNYCRAAVRGLEITAMPERYSIYCLSSFSLLNIYVQKEKCVFSTFLEDKCSNACSGIDFSYCLLFLWHSKRNLNSQLLGKKL